MVVLFLVLWILSQLSFAEKEVSILVCRDILLCLFNMPIIYKSIVILAWKQTVEPRLPFGIFLSELLNSLVSLLILLLSLSLLILWLKMSESNVYKDSYRSPYLLSFNSTLDLWRSCADTDFAIRLVALKPEQRKFGIRNLRFFFVIY